MDIDPMDLLDKDEADKHETIPAEVAVNHAKSQESTRSQQEKQKSRLNTAVAIAVALLATFMGVCKVKDDNLVQAMQQAQANKIDDWALYQARNIRSEIAKSTIVQLQLQKESVPSPATRAAYDQQIAVYQELAKREDEKKQSQKAIAEADQQTYDQLNFHDDQFDLSDASLAIAIALLAITSLSQKRWLFGVAMLPTAFGVVMGLSGLLGWGLHPDALTKLLSQNSLQNSIEWDIACSNTASCSHHGLRDRFWYQ